MEPDELTASVREFDAVLKEANEAIEQAREKRDDKIRQADQAGMRQVDICAATGYTRETVRQILKPEAKAAALAAARAKREAARKSAKQ